jgi:hypothetical protein
MTTTYEARNENYSLVVELKEGLILSAQCNLDSHEATSFCQTLLGMKLADAAYYGAKKVIESLPNTAQGIAFVHHHEDLRVLDSLIKQIFAESDEPDNGRYVPKELKQWLSKDKQSQKDIINKSLNEFFEGNSLYQFEKVFVQNKGATIILDLTSISPKNQFQKLLVRIEKHIRTALNGAPIILTIEELADANTKRR